MIGAARPVGRKSRRALGGVTSNRHFAPDLSRSAWSALYVCRGPSSVFWFILSEATLYGAAQIRRGLPVGEATS